MEVSRRHVLRISGAAAVAVGAGVAASPASASVTTPGAGASTSTAGAVASAGGGAARAKAVALVKQMTLDEKIAQLHGTGYAGFTGGHAGVVPANTRLGIPALYLADGPSGVGDFAIGVTQWPDSKTLAASWDPSLARRYGEAYGAEQAGKGNNIALAPCINILRLPYWGRSFETYTEDPYLNGQLVAETVKGIQSQYVVATVKHFAANNQEILRNSINVVVSHRALHEIYFPGFRAAVQEGGTGAIMTSYNQVNGHYASENDYDINQTLRGEWGFDGLVMSDWGGTHSTVAAAEAGSDMEMPTSDYFGAALKTAVQNGTVAESVVDGMAADVLTAMYRVGLFDHPLPDPATVFSTTVSSTAHLALAKTIAEEGSVLLKNRGALPLSDRVRSIAVIGDAADLHPQAAGGGSGAVTAWGTPITPLAGITARANGIAINTARGTMGIGALDSIPASAFGNGLTATYYATADFSGTPVATETVATLGFPSVPSPVAALTSTWSVRYTGTLTAAIAGGYRFSVFTGGTATSLAIDGKTVLDYLTSHESVQNAFVELSQGPHTLTAEFVSVADGSVGGYAGFSAGGLQVGYQPNYRQLIAEAADTARAADVAVVFVADVTSEGMDRSTLALPADQDELIAEVARANPNTVVVLNTSGAVLMPWLDDVDGVIANWYAGQEQGAVIAALLFGDVEPGGRLTETFPADDRQGPARTTDEYPGNGTDVYYDEGLAIGYRWYQKSGQQPLFPFGYGLSYTSFELEGLRVQPGEDGGAQARVTLRNTGRRSGSEVVQLYLAYPDAAGEPSPILKAFAKVSLEPGRSQSITLDLPREDFEIWDESTRQWTVVPGRYTVMVGRSSADLPLRAEIDRR